MRLSFHASLTWTQGSNPHDTDSTNTVEVSSKNGSCRFNPGRNVQCQTQVEADLPCRQSHRNLRGVEHGQLRVPAICSSRSRLFPHDKAKNQGAPASAACFAGGAPACWELPRTWARRSCILNSSAAIVGLQFYLLLLQLFQNLWEIGCLSRR